MDSKGFFLGLIAAVVLFLLWKKETVPGFGALGLPAVGPQPSNGGPGGGCAGCGGGPSASAAPSAQGMLPATYGTDGQISPGTPPLQGSLGVGSFYNPTGPTPDNTFLTTPLSRPPANTSITRPILVTSGTGDLPVTPGSPSTPSNQVPVRAVQPVAPTSQLGFQQRWSFVGIPRTAGARGYVM